MVTLEEKTLKDIAIFVAEKLSTLDSVLSASTHFILKRYKVNGTILDKHEEYSREVITP